MVPASLPFPTLLTFQRTSALRLGSALKFTNPAGPPALHNEQSALAEVIIPVESAITPSAAAHVPRFIICFPFLKRFRGTRLQKNPPVGGPQNDFYYVHAAQDPVRLTQLSLIFLWSRLVWGIASPFKLTALSKHTAQNAHPIRGVCMCVRNVRLNLCRGTCANNVRFCAKCVRYKRSS